jgi:hypothetical protein
VPACSPSHFQSQLLFEKIINVTYCTAGVAELVKQQQALKEQLTGIEGRLEDARKAEEAALQAFKAAEQCFDRAERQASFVLPHC